MAGGSQRFWREGCRVPKPMIPVLGRPMVVASCLSFPPAARWIFVAKSQHLQRYPVVRDLSEHFPNVETIALDQTTRGQACTCLAARGKLSLDEPLFIASCDYQTVYDDAAYTRLTDNPDVDVVVWTFRGGTGVYRDPRAFAYCRTEGSRVVEVAEKRLISGSPSLDPAVAGSFYFRRAEQFVRGAEAMIAKDIRVNGEFYVGTSLNQLISEGLRVVTFEVDQFISFGDPLELKVLQYWEEYFNDLEGFPYKARYGPRLAPQGGETSRSP